MQSDICQKSDWRRHKVLCRRVCTVHARFKEWLQRTGDGVSNFLFNSRYTETIDTATQCLWISVKELEAGPEGFEITYNRRIEFSGEFVAAWRDTGTPGETTPQMRLERKD